jgi:hypothetical protein
MTKRTRLASALAAVLVAATLLHAQGPGINGTNSIHSAYLHADFTDANASGAQAIPGLLFYLAAGGPATTWRLDCQLAYSQATVVADNFGITFGVAPTNSMFWGVMATNATAYGSGTPVAVTSTANATITTGTPAVTTVLGTLIEGYVEMPATSVDTSVQITVTQATAADVIVVKRDSGCTWHSMN